MPTRNINLTERLDLFVETSLASGRYGNASEVVREGLRLLEQREAEEKAKLKWLRSAAKAGLEQLDRGEGIEFRSIEDMEKEIDRIGREASTELASGKVDGKVR